MRAGAGGEIVQLFGPLHLALVAITVALSAVLSWACATRPNAVRPLRLAMGIVLAATEITWYVFRYSQEAIHAGNLPLELCDVVAWLACAACLRLSPAIVEVAYFAGVAGAGMAILTPDLWSPWPSFAAIVFFVSHGAIVVAVSMLVFGRVVPLRPGAVWRSFGWLLLYVLALMIVNAVTGANYMYLRRKPEAASLLNVLGPWPVYLFTGAAVALALFWLLWLPAPKRGTE